MDIYIVLRAVILLSLLTVAAITDLFKHRVSNHIIASGFIAELFVHMLSKPAIVPEELGISVLFILICFALFVLGLLGGADVKLYALCIFTYPDETGFRIICLSLVIGAVYAFLIKLRAAKTLYGTSICLSGNFCTTEDTDKCNDSDAAAVPMAAAILAGTMLAVI